MDSNLLVRIDLSRKSFSKGQRKIASFIEEHYDTAALMTAAKLGEVVGVSESTVVRFAATLGYDGYPAMRKALQEMIKNRLTTVQRIEVARGMISEGDLYFSEYRPMGDRKVSPMDTSLLPLALLKESK